MFTVLGDLSGSSAYSVTFWRSGVQITAQVLAGTYTVSDLNHGIQVTIEVRVHASSTAGIHAKRNIDAYVSSASAPTVTDVVRGHVTRA